MDALLRMDRNQKEVIQVSAEKNDIKVQQNYVNIIEKFERKIIQAIIAS